MSQIEVLKEQFHDLIDGINDESILVQYYRELSDVALLKDNDLWSDLTEEEQADIKAAIDESEDEANLISHEEVKKKYAKWLTK